MSSSELAKLRKTARRLIREADKLNHLADVLEYEGQTSPEAKLRAFRDSDAVGGLWYELAPDQFRFNASRSEAEILYSKNPDGSKRLSYINCVYGPLTEVTDAP
jgi:hypothetical protein